ncbi:MAG TPA: FtsH protease activity modulator HflK [Gammaproteobacteria bacterium]
MAWNEPGGNNKDPWSGRRKNEGPPDLDEVFKDLQARLRGLFGGKSAGGGNSAGIGLIVGIFLVIWFISGIYIVDEDERGVVLQFGKYTATTQPGPHWYPRMIQSVEIVSVTSIRNTNGSAHALTGDENIVNVDYTIQYNVKDAYNYLFKVHDPDLTLRQASESAFRDVIGNSTLDYVIQEGRDVVSVKARDLLQETMDLYESGLNIINVNLISAQPPQEVQEAIDDATKAGEDKERYIKEAEAYRNEIVPVARGTARSMLEEAEAYKFATIASAEGEADRFLKVLTEYEKAPRVTRERLYLEALETMLTRNDKILVDTKSGNNLIYLPLDKLGQQSGGRVLVEPIDPNAASNPSRGTGSARDDYRSRGQRQ